MGSRRFFQARAGKPDANADAIIKALRALGHFCVPIRSSDPGVADLCVHPRPSLADGQCLAVEDRGDDERLFCGGRQGHEGSHRDCYGSVIERPYFRDPPPKPEPVYLELKVAKGRLLKSQVEWRASAEARGIRVVTVRSVDEALEALK